MSKKQVVILFSVIALVLIFGGYFVWKSNQDVPSTGYITVSGVLISADLSKMATDGPGIYQIKSNDGKNYQISLTSGESTCDRSAIAIPSGINEGSLVEAHGKVIHGDVVICDPGTYIKSK